MIAAVRVDEYTRINLFYHSLNLQKRIHRPFYFGKYFIRFTLLKRLMGIMESVGVLGFLQR